MPPQPSEVRTQIVAALNAANIRHNDAKLTTFFDALIAAGVLRGEGTREKLAVLAGRTVSSIRNHVAGTERFFVDDVELGSGP